MTIRSRTKRQMRERSRHHVFAAGYKLKRGRRYEFRMISRDGELMLSGWFLADSNNPVCCL